MPNEKRAKENSREEGEHDDLRLDLSKLPQWASSEAVSENWGRGVALNESWFDCLSKVDKRRYQIEQSDHRRAWIRSEVHFEIIEALFDSTLIAIGSIESEFAIPSLAKLDAFLFRPGVCAIDWQNGHVKSLGKRFLNVHVVRNILVQAAPSLVSAPSQQVETVAPKRGRKSLYPLLARAARNLAEREPLFRE